MATIHHTVTLTVTEAVDFNRRMATTTRASRRTGGAYSVFVPCGGGNLEMRIQATRDEVSHRVRKRKNDRTDQTDPADQRTL